MPSQTIPALKDPYRLTLDSDVQELLTKSLCDTVKAVWAACSDRDDELRTYRDQLEASALPETNEPWPGACQLESTITRELHTTLLAAIWSACRATPYVGLEAADASGEGSASRVETFANLKAQEFGFDDALYHQIYLALEGRYSVLFVGHQQDIRRSFDATVVSDPENPDGGEHEELILREDPVAESVQFRTVDPWDFYVDPLTAYGPQLKHGCLRTIERMVLTREDLLMGVLTDGFERDAVLEMIEKGPTSSENGGGEERSRDGIESEGPPPGGERESGLWECAYVIGRTPFLDDEDGNPSIPEGLMHVDAAWMLCPQHNICFKQSYSRFDDGDRPYALFHALEKPYRMYGEGIGSLISPLHEEMTAVMRFGINNMNLEASPVMTVTEAWLLKYAKYTVMPGRFMPRQASDPIGPKPLTWDVRSQPLVMEWLQYLDAQANRLGASQGLNSMLAGKTRKAAEVYYAEAIQHSKFDLYVANIQKGVKEAFRLMLSILLKRMRERNDTEAAALTQGGEVVTISVQDLSQIFRLIPHASTDSMSPASRMAKQQLIDQIVLSYWQGLPVMAQLGGVPYWYALKHRLLVLADERSPERYIGPDPTNSPDQMQQLLVLAAMQNASGGAPGSANGTGGAPAGLQLPGFAGGGGSGLLQASALSPRDSGGGEGE